VRCPTLGFLSLPSLLTLLGAVLVLDQPPVPGRTPRRRIRLAVGGTVCFGDTLRSTVFLDGGSLVGR
jgi:hypothetical protein